MYLQKYLHLCNNVYIRFLQEEFSITSFLSLIGLRGPYTPNEINEIISKNILTSSWPSWLYCWYSLYCTIETDSNTKNYSDCLSRLLLPKMNWFFHNICLVLEGLCKGQQLEAGTIGEAPWVYIQSGGAF